jgi:hypothetical protein
LVIFGRQYPGKTPVLGVDLIDHNMDVLRLLAEVCDKACGDVVDERLFLCFGYGSLCKLDVDVWHSVERNNISGLTSAMTYLEPLARRVRRSPAPKVTAVEGYVDRSDGLLFLR